MARRVWPSRRGLTVSRPRVLLAQELGVGRWHAEALAVLAAAAARAGLDPVMALPDPAVAAHLARPDGRLLASPHHMPGPSRRRKGPSRSHADILDDAGWDDAAVLGVLLASWRSLLGLVAPAFVVADAAPTLALAARGRVPVVTVGLGFTQPATSGDPRPLPALTPSTEAERAALEPRSWRTSPPVACTCDTSERPSRPLRPM